MTNRRLFIKGATGVAAAALLARVPFLQAAYAQGVAGGNFVAAMSHEPASLDPIFGTASPVDRCYYNLYTEGLVYQDSEGTLQPLLATDWQVSEDGRTITFNLREGVKFHDGTDFNAEAAKFNLDRAKNPDLRSSWVSFLSDLDTVDVTGPMQIRLNLKRSSAPLLITLAQEAGSMLSPTAIAGMGPDFARFPVGTGAFTVVGWQGDKLDVKRNDSYWGGPALMESVTVRKITNTAVKLVELQAGTVHLGDAIQVKDFDSVSSDPNLRLVDTIDKITCYIAFNVRPGHPFADNIHLRRAFTHAINRQALEMAISRGEGGVMNSLLVPTAKSHNPAFPGQAYDPDFARSELAASGFSGVINMMVIQRDPDTQIAQIVQAMCKDVGLEVNLEVLDRAAWVERALKGDFECGLLRDSQPKSDDDLTFSAFFSRSAPSNYAGIYNETIYNLIDEARGFTDPEARKANYIEVQRILLDNCHFAHLFWRPQKFVMRKEVSNFSIEFNSSWQFNKMGLDG